MTAASSDQTASGGTAAAVSLQLEDSAGSHDKSSEHATSISTTTQPQPPPAAATSNDPPPRASPLPGKPTQRQGRPFKKMQRSISPAVGRARGLTSRIKRFSPAWFSVTMGSGIPSVLLFNMPWASTHIAFRGIGTAFLIFDMLLFGIFACMIITRYILYPAIFPATLRHEVHSLFIGTFPMGYITITTAIAIYGNSFQLPGAVIAASVMFWIEVVLALFSVLIVPWFMVTKHSHRTEGLTAAWLLPYVPPLTVASSGSAISALLLESHPDYALDILLASYINLGIGLFTACAVLVLYLQRLTLHKLPPKEVIVSTFLPLGPCGQGGYAAVQLGLVASRLFPLLADNRPESQAWQDLRPVGSVLYGTGILLGLLLFAFGAWWAWIAVSAVGSHLWMSYKKAEKYRTTFSLGWWATTFPVGSMNLVIYALGNSFDNMFFKVLGTILTAFVCLCWLIVTVPTINGFRRGTLFDAPCLADVAKKQQLKMELQQAEKLPAEQVAPETEPA